MGNSTKLAGVFAAAVTPLQGDLSPDLDGMAKLVNFLAGRGCHGVLVLGTTGEGPSFSIDERRMIYRVTAEVGKDNPELILLAGTGTPSLEETITLTREAFEQGFHAVVVLPPYYFRKAPDDGLFNWFSQVIDKAVPEGGSLLCYHIPPTSGIGLSLDLLSRLKDAYPEKFLGIKDSSGDPEWARQLGKRFGDDLTVFNGNDRFFTLSLQAKSSGCITALANILSPLHRIVWDNFQAGIDDEITQDKLSGVREVFDRYPPMPPAIKLMLNRLYGFPAWKVKPPLVDFDSDNVEILLSEYLAAME